jgi:PPM family protein phosphatase
VSDDSEVGDVYILCSDGLSGMVDDSDIRDVAGTIVEPELACRRLVTMANEHGGEDNVTAVVIRIEEGEVRSRLELATTQEMPSITPLHNPNGDKKPD